MKIDWEIGKKISCFSGQILDLILYSYLIFLLQTGENSGDGATDAGSTTSNSPLTDQYTTTAEIRTGMIKVDTGTKSTTTEVEISETTAPSTSKIEEESTTQQTPLVESTNTPTTQSPVQPSTEGAPPPKSTPDAQTPTEPTPEQSTSQSTPQPTIRTELPTQPSKQTTENIATSSNKIDGDSGFTSEPTPATSPTLKPKVSYVNLCLLLFNMHSPTEY